MILATVGMQLPFPRLMAALDRLAPLLGARVLAQTGPDTGRYPGLETVERLLPQDFAVAVAQARVIVAHAGIGTVLTAKAACKPLILFPRRHALGEHRNDHQIATARQLQGERGLHVAWGEADLERLLRAPALAGMTAAPGPHAPALIAHIRDFIDEGR